MKPQNPITRQEAAALFTKILPPVNFDKDEDKDNNDDKFADQAQIPAWSQAAIAAAVQRRLHERLSGRYFPADQTDYAGRSNFVLDRAARHSL